MTAFRVQDKYRTNPLSHRPGGYEVMVAYQDGKIFVYDKVKIPGSYVESIERQGKNSAEHGPVIEVWVDQAKVWDHTTDKSRNPWEISDRIPQTPPTPKTTEEDDLPF